MCVAWRAIVSQENKLLTGPKPRYALNWYSFFPLFAVVLLSLFDFTLSHLVFRADHFRCRAPEDSIGYGGEP